MHIHLQVTFSETGGFEREDGDDSCLSDVDDKLDEVKGFDDIAVEVLVVANGFDEIVLLLLNVDDFNIEVFETGVSKREKGFFFNSKSVSQSESLRSVTQ